MRLTVLFALLLGWLVSAGQTLPSRVFTTDDKLGSRDVTGAIQSRAGFLWMTTMAGLSRFDGKEFRNYSQADGLLNDAVRLPLEDRKGCIWVWMESGEFAFYQEGRIHTSQTDPFLKKAVFPENAIPHAVAEDAQGRIWWATSHQFLCLADTTVFTGEIPPPFGSAMAGYCQFLMGQDGSVRLVAQDQVLKWDGQCFDWEPSRFVPLPGVFSPSRGDSILFFSAEGVVLRNGREERLLIARNRLPQGVNSCYIDRKGNLLIGTSSRGFWQIPQRLRAGEEPAIPLAVNQRLTKFLVEDHEGNLWFSVAGMGVVLVPQGLSRSVWLDRENGLRSPFITAVDCDEGHNFWFGDIAGNVGIWNPEHGWKYVLDGDSTRLLRPVVGILSFEDGNVWVGMSDALYQFKGKDTWSGDFLPPQSFRLSNTINAMQPIAGNQFSVAMVCDIGIFDPDSSHADVLSMRQTALKKKYCHAWGMDGKLWFAIPNGLALYENGSETLLEGVNQFVSSRIQDILVWGGDTLLLATHGQGIVFCIGGRYIGHLDREDGLPSPRCKRLFRDENKVWVSTDEGVAVVQFDRGLRPGIKRFSVADGLKSVVVDGIAVGGNHWMAIGSKGISILPVDQDDMGRVIPFVAIDSLLAGGKSAVGGSIPYADRDIQVKWVGIAFGHPKALQFRYRLIRNGILDPWVPSVATALNFQSTAPGNYIFEVQASVGGGTWSPSATYPFKVLKPFWQQAWFIVLLVLVLLSLIILLFRWRIAVVRGKYKAQLRLRSQIAALEHQAVQSMMNPHFIFNVMNSIRHFMQDNDLSAADDYLSRFAKLVRSNLVLVAKPLIDLEEETAFLRDYLSLEALRFQEGLTWEIIVSPALEEEVLLPSMLLQPFVENAIWHGLLPLKGQGMLKIYFEPFGEDGLEIRIEDNGVGMGNAPEKDGHVSKGMAMTEDRLRLLGEMVGREIYLAHSPLQADNMRPGTVVTIRIPLDLHPSDTA